MKPLIIYHRSCADGFGAAYSAWLRFGDEAEYLPMQYGEWEKLFEDYPQGGSKFDGRDVYVLDFSFSNLQTKILLDGSSRFVWLDHHKTAFESWCGLDYLTPEQQQFGWINHDREDLILLDNTRSGALIAWDYFHLEKPVPQLIRHIDDYDRWQFKIPGTKALNKAIWAESPWTFEQWGTWMSQPLDGMMQTGSYLLKDHEQRVRASVSGGSMSCDIQGIKGLAVNCPPNMTSDVGHQLAIVSGTYGLCWTLDKDKIVQCSLRSNGDFDVSAIAKELGGGGHKNAAGFKTNLAGLKNILEM